MPRLSITLPDALYNQLSELSVAYDESMSSVIKRLIQFGMIEREDGHSNQSSKVEQHCQQLIIQMNALIKNMSAEMLKFNQRDFEELRDAAIKKYQQLSSVN